MLLIKLAGRIIKDVFTVIVISFSGLLLLTTFSLSDKYRLLAVRSGSMRPAISEGSLILTVKQSDYKKGDIIAYKTASNIITHRIYSVETSGGAKLYTTKGDANNRTDEKPVRNNQILGRVGLIIPFLGKIVLFSKTQAGFIFLIVIPGTAIVYSEIIALKEKIRLKSKIIFLACLFAYLFYPKTAIALTKTSGDLRLIIDEPIFPSNIIWYPSLFKQNVMTIGNSGNKAKKVYFRAENTSQTGNIAQVLFFTITKEGVNLYGGASGKTLQNFWDEGDVELFNLGGESSADVNVKLNMSSNAGNEYQAKKAQFDLVIGFVETGEAVTVTAAANGGGGDGSGGASATVCGDAKPNTPSNFSVSAGPGVGEVVLTWAAPPTPPPYTYFLVAYSDTDAELKWGNPNIGSGTNYTVSGLAAGTYYFWVRSGNGCMPGDFIGPESIAIGIGAPGAAPEVPAAGFERGVLGESTPSAETATSPTANVANGEVKGAKEARWLLLLAILTPFAFAIIYLYFINGRK